MDHAETIHYQLGLPEGLELEAARLYDEAFGRKLAMAVRSADARVRILAESIVRDRAMVALDGGRIVGLAGFHDDRRHFTGAGSFGTLSRHVGWAKALWAALVFALLEREPEPGELLMDGIAVDASARGQGVGTALLERLYAYAALRGYERIRLEVIDTNPGARRLYERVGFEAVETSHYPILKRAMGFSAVTTMVRPVEPATVS